MSAKKNGTWVIGLCLIFGWPLLAQVNDTSGVMDQRLRTIAGDSALDCGRVRVNGDAEPALKCARKAIAKKQPFFVRCDYWGTDSLLSDGLAGNSSGDVYLVRFDSYGWGLGGAVRDEILDEKHDFVEACPKPVHIREAAWVNTQFAGVTCKRRKKNSDDRYEW